MKERNQGIEASNLFKRSIHLHPLFQKHNPSSQYAQEVKNECFLSSSHFYIQEVSFFRVWKRTQSFTFHSLRDEHTTNRLEAERKHHLSCLSCATKAQRMSGRIFLFPLLSLASLLSLSYVFLGNSMFSLAFCTCPPLPIKEKEGWWTSKITYKHITLNFTQMHIFQFVLFPICICIIFNHLSPKIMYIQGKLRWNMWNYGVYQWV